MKNQTEDSRIEYNKENAYILMTLALPYLYGARLQVERYKKTCLGLKSDSVNATTKCLHEISCLFEDLGSIKYYADLCGKTNESHRLFIEVRNHIRHDIRENFDSDDKRRNKRLGYLGIDEKYQTQIGFSPEKIKIGRTIIEINTINKYLDWVTNIVNLAINEAWKKGKIKMDDGKR